MYMNWAIPHQNTLSLLYTKLNTTCYPTSTSRVTVINSFNVNRRSNLWTSTSAIYFPVHLHLHSLQSFFNSAPVLILGFILLVVTIVAYLSPLGRYILVSFSPSARLQHLRRDIESLYSLVPNDGSDHMRAWVWR
jgi:hypothetical protein